MQTSPITIGPIDLRDFEIPQSVRFGGRHRIAVHALAGGQRIIERLGPDDTDITFQGVFSGPGAQTRAQILDDLRQSGDIVWLTWESFRRQVIVRNFEAEYHNRWWIPFRINCIATDQANPYPILLSNLVTTISTDTNAAVAASLGSPISLASLQVALSATSAFTPGTENQARAISVVDSTINAINDQIFLQSNLLMQPIPQNTDPAQFGELYGSILGNAASLSAMINTRSYVGRIGVNIRSYGG